MAGTGIMHQPSGGGRQIRRSGSRTAELAAADEMGADMFAERRRLSCGANANTPVRGGAFLGHKALSELAGGRSASPAVRAGAWRLARQRLWDGRSASAIRPPNLTTKRGVETHGGVRKRLRLSPPLASESRRQHSSLTHARTPHTPDRAREHKNTPCSASGSARERQGGY